MQPPAVVSSTSDCPTSLPDISSIDTADELDDNSSSQANDASLDMADLYWQDRLRQGVLAFFWPSFDFSTVPEDNGFEHVTVASHTETTSSVRLGTRHWQAHVAIALDSDDAMSTPPTPGNFLASNNACLTVRCLSF